MQNKILKIKQNLKGFTIIELMVVVIIVFIVSAASFSVYNKNNGRKDLDVAAREVASVIREMQNNALGGKTYGGNFSCGYAFSYGLGANKDEFAKKYSQKVSGNCQPSGPTLFATGSNIKLSNKVKFDTPASQAIFFSVPWAEIGKGEDKGISSTSPMSPLPSSGVVITLKPVNSANYRIDICVCPTGKVFETKVRKNTDPSTCAAAC